MNDVEDDLFLMANLRPADTGLPMVVWVSERGYARHAARVKVSRTHGERINPRDTVTFGVQPPGLIAGYLPPADERVVERWITLNEQVILEYWDSQISTAEMLKRIRPLQPPVPP